MEGASKNLSSNHHQFNHEPSFELHLLYCLPIIIQSILAVDPVLLDHRDYDDDCEHEEWHFVPENRLEFKREKVNEYGKT